MTDLPRPTLRDLVRGAARVLAEAGVPSPEHDARELAAHVLGTARLELWSPPPVPPEFSAEYAAVVERRRRREPLQHVVGTAPFRHLTLRVGPGAFVPRPETEHVAQMAIDEALRVVPTRGPAAGEVVVVDLCTGSGAIALAVADEVPAAVVHAVEVDAAAHAWAERNLAAHAGDGSGRGSRVRLHLADATSPQCLRGLDGTVDVVVANPPYIPPDAVPQDPEVRDHDPDVALYGGGADGLAVPRGVVATARRLLRGGGLLVMEHAEVQATAVRDAVGAAGGFTDVRTRQDLTGRDRMVVARRCPAGSVEDSPP